MSIGLVPPRPPVHLNRQRIRSQVRDGELAPGAAGGFSARGELGTFMILMRPGAIGEKKGAGIGDIQGFWAQPAVAADGAGIPVFRGVKFLPPAPLLHLVVSLQSRI